MSGAKFTDEFKRDAVAQVEDRGYPVREVAERLGVSVKASQRQRVSTSAGSLGSRPIDNQSQNKTVAARAMADRKTFGHLS